MTNDFAINTTKEVFGVLRERDGIRTLLSTVFVGESGVDAALRDARRIATNWARNYFTSDQVFVAVIPDRRCSPVGNTDGFVKARRV